ncbi:MULTISPECIES: SSI family serine proteinase inhibitor [Streptomyces]|uniref:SSI family serine proteinase inhibitor n=1 Tax=Streptomyces TaxID=1883 RepID=UPI000CD59969|nr:MULTISPECIES: SSI family serine proteinase inhibitor [Streptomyces]
MPYTALATALAAAAALTGTATGASTEPAPESRLSISVSETGDPADAKTYNLTCGPAGGDHSNASAACDELTTAGEGVFSPVSRSAVCTQMHGGDATAHITGVWAGAPVDATFSRSNGCEMHRWDQLGTVLAG